MADLDISNVIDSMANDAKKWLSKKTNADKIRNMDDAELAEFINGIERYDDYAILINGDTVIDMTSCILEWLQSEAE